MKKWKTLFLVILCFVLLIGCARMNIIDQLSIVHVYGFDVSKDGQLVGTVLYPNYTKSRGNPNIQYLTEHAPPNSVIYEKMDKYTSTPIKLSKIRVLVFSKKYAKTNISDIIKRFITTPELGTNIQIVVSEKSAQEILKAIKEGEDLTLADRLKQNMLTQNLPDMNLHVFLNHFFGEGMDAYVPIVSLNRNNGIDVGGVGIFKGDKFKLQLNEEQSFFFSILETVKTQGWHRFKVDDNGQRGIIIVRGFRSKKNWDLINKQNNPELNLTMNLEWTVFKYPDWLDLSNDTDLKRLKTMIEEEVKKKVEQLLTTFKENKVDPLGIGNIVRARDKNWEETAFYKKYPNLPIHVKVNLEIIHTGLEK
ncbi:Ger(x)C family spore germination protein [Neobacillus sp. SAB-20_R2A]|uniref:Ger(x)C family spore germination protein n=1 Tax=Neobacillus sp. SAB-20_R2A TaxID=3120519 RepID=UPI003C6DF4C3